MVAGPDLTVAKSHSGTFQPGQPGQYAITVRNVGTAPTDGTLVTVTDTLPAGLSATAVGGPGWTCTLATLTCTRSDVLAAGASYPDITLSVTVAPDASGTLSNGVVVAGGGDVNPSNNTGSDEAPIGGVAIPSLSWMALAALVVALAALGVLALARRP